MMNIIIRHATLDDLDAMIKVGDQLFDNPVKPERTIEFLSDPRHHLILGFDGDDVVAMASALHYVHPDKDPALFINEVGVIDDYQNNGIGRKIVKAMINHGKNIGCTDIWVATETSNAPARACYIAAGGTEDDDHAVVYVWENNLKI